MIYPPGLSISDDPDIFGDKIVWGRSTDYYYDIGLQEMVYPEGLFIYGHPAIYGTKIVSSRSRGYYDLDLQQYILVRVFLGEKPDIFEDSVVGRNYDAIGPITVNIFIWEPVCKQRQISDSGCAFTPKIYNDLDSQKFSLPYCVLRACVFLQQCHVDHSHFLHDSTKFCVVV